MEVHDLDVEDVTIEPVCERKLHNTRARVDELIAEGWTIVARNPVILQRGTRKLEIRPNGILVSL